MPLEYHENDIRFEEASCARDQAHLRSGYEAREISRLCHESGEPIFITTDGQGDLVVMSLAAYERDRARLDPHRLLDEAEGDLRSGDRGRSIQSVRKRLGR